MYITTLGYCGYSIPLLKKQGVGLTTPGGLFVSQDAKRILFAWNLEWIYLGDGLTKTHMTMKTTTKTSEDVANRQANAVVLVYVACVLIACLFAAL